MQYTVQHVLARIYSHINRTVYMGAYNYGFWKYRGNYGKQSANHCIE